MFVTGISIFSGMITANQTVIKFAKSYLWVDLKNPE